MKEPLQEIINIKEETDQEVVDLANKENRALIAFIAPFVSVRLSPVHHTSVTIGVPDEFGIEALVNELARSNIDKAFLLINSPGGSVDSAYKISRALKSVLKEVTSFVPHVAASGGTLLALTGNKIVMGPMSHITPLDVQVPYKGEYISACSFQKFLTRAEKWFEKIQPEEAPYPKRALVDMLDPFIMEEWAGITKSMNIYVRNILILAGYKKENANTIAQTLVEESPAHSFVINSVIARGLGLNVEDASSCKQNWDVMRHWLGKYSLEQEVTHCIRYVIPQKSKKISSAGKKKGVKKSIVKKATKKKLRKKTGTKS